MHLAQPPDVQTRSGRLRNIANMYKPIIDIRLNDAAPEASTQAAAQRSNFIYSFSTQDKIEGVAYFTPTTDTPFDDVEISFTGHIKTHVDRVGTVSAVNNRTEAFHQFLKLTQPINTDLYPEPRVAKTGVTYEFPFTFVVPDELLPSSCRHRAHNPTVKNAHLQLPPSLGDPDLAGTGSTLLDDMSPDMVRILYVIKARMIRYRPRDGKETTICDRNKKIRVIPATFEQPPVDIDGMDEEYELRKEKGVKRGIFKSKSGRLVAQVSQPRSLRLQAPNTPDPCAPSTMASIMLRFDPADANQAPPKLGSLSSKLKVATYFSSAPFTNIPSKARMLYEATQGIHIETLNLSSRCVSQAQWQRHEPGTTPAEASMRRDSAVSVSTGSGLCPEPSKSYTPDKPFHTAQLLVPIALPTNKSFVPTFHSCLVSRIYILDLNLSVPSQGGGAGVPSTLLLKVPVQVTSDSDGIPPGSALPGSPEDDTALFGEQIDNFFLPRSVAPPPAQFLENGRIGTSVATAGSDDNPAEPPGYSYFAHPGEMPVYG